MVRPRQAVRTTALDLPRLGRRCDTYQGGGVTLSATTIARMPTATTMSTRSSKRDGTER